MTFYSDISILNQQVHEFLGLVARQNNLEQETFQKLGRQPSGLTISQIKNKLERESLERSLKIAKEKAPGQIEILEKELNLAYAVDLISS